MSPAADFCSLQWGRNLTVAEGVGVWVCLASAGVASMGPQLDSCGRIITQATPTGFRKLQWGRNLTVAEGFPARENAGGAPLLQWGRNLTVAEGEAARRFNVKMSKLPWGRNLTLAEGKRRGTNGSNTTGFNGAAT